MIRRDRQAYVERLVGAGGTVMLSLHGAEGEYVEVSAAVHELLGLPADEVIGRSAYEFFHPDDLARIATSHAVVASTNQVTTVEYRLRHDDGHYTSVRTISWGELEEGDDGHIVALTAPVRDLSERQLRVLESIPVLMAQDVIEDILQ